jgi:hypothetical protein
MSEAALTAVLDLAGGTEHAVTSGVRADPATAGRITVRIPAGDMPPDALIVGILVHCGNGTWFRRWFRPHLTVPPGGTLSVSFGVEDMRHG